MESQIEVKTITTSEGCEGSFDSEQASSTIVVGAGSCNNDEQLNEKESSGVERSIQQISFSNTGSHSRSLPSSYQMRFGSMNQNMIGCGEAEYGANNQSGYKYHGYKGVSRWGTIAASIGSTSFNASEFTSDAICTRAEEKVALGCLNNRFVTYIEKVRALVTRNQMLEAKIKQLESSHTSGSLTSLLYETQLHKLQKEIEIAIYEKTQVEIRLESFIRELDDYKKKFQRECEDREEAENEVKSLFKLVDQATLVRVELESKVDSLQIELNLLKKSSQEDIHRISQQMVGVQIGETVVDGVMQQTDLSEALREIRVSYEKLTQTNKVEIESHYKSIIIDLNVQVKELKKTCQTQKVEITEKRSLLDTATVKLEGLRTSFATLEFQLKEAEDRYQNELSAYQLRITKLEKELSETQEKFKTQLIEYSELFNVKCSLDLEIKAYRKLLEGEENRICVSGFGMNYSGSVAITGSKISGFESVQGGDVAISSENCEMRKKENSLVSDDGSSSSDDDNTKSTIISNKEELSYLVNEAVDAKNELLAEKLKEGSRSSNDDESKADTIHDKVELAVVLKEAATANDELICQNLQGALEAIQDEKQKESLDLEYGSEN